jgi:parallel beta-helix repeat protein
MNREALTVLALFMCALVSVSGCLEDTPPQDDEPEPNNKQMVTYVDDDYGDTTPGWGTDHFKKIQDAINNTGASGTIHVHNGTYNENLRINRSMTLLGEDKAQTIINSSNNTHVISILAGNCTIQNITVTNSSYRTGIMIQSDNNTITNNIIESNKNGLWVQAQLGNTINGNIITSNENGITLKRAPSTTIRNNQVMANTLGGIKIDSSKNAIVTDNELTSDGMEIEGILPELETYHINNNTANGRPIHYFKDRKDMTITSDAAQLILVNCSDSVIRDMSFQDTTIPIQLLYCSNMKIEDNHFASTTINALMLYDSEHNTITGNEMRSKTGVYLSNSRYNQITQNNLENTTTGVDLVTSRYNNITRNQITSSKQYGLFMQSSSYYNTITGNRIQGNYYGMRIKSAKHNNVHHNEFKGNSKAGIYICCGAEYNTVNNNSFIDNEKNARYTTDDVNYMDSDGFGNYWDDYLERYPDAKQANGTWDTPYRINGSSQEDNYPLVEPVTI